MIDNYANVRKEGSITIIHIDNPPANALSVACIDNLRSILQGLGEDNETSAIILTGSGRFFVAGADIKEFVSEYTFRYSYKNFHIIIPLFLSENYNLSCQTVICSYKNIVSGYYIGSGAFFK